MTEHDRSRDVESEAGLRLSRRRTLQGAAWSVPVITVASAAPAFASSVVSLSATWNSDSFRCNSGAEFTAGTASNGTYAVGARIDLVVSNGTLSNLTATLTNRAAAPNGFTIFNNTNVGNRPTAVSPTTTWKINNGSLADDNWTVTPAPSGTQVTSFLFTQGNTSFSSGMLRFVLGGYSASGANSDFPATLTFNADELAAPVSLSITTSTSTSPYVFGA